MWRLDARAHVHEQLPAAPLDSEKAGAALKGAVIGIYRRLVCVYVQLVSPANVVSSVMSHQMPQLEGFGGKTGTPLPVSQLMLMLTWNA